MRLIFLLSFSLLMAAAEPGYETRTINGWQVLIEDSFAKANDETLAKVVAELTSQLHGIVRMVPAPALEKIRAVPIWVNRKSGTACMAFHPSAEWLSGHGFNPHMANSVEIGNAENFISWTRQQPWMVLHELAHAYHFRQFGYQYPPILNAWQNAKQSGTYDSVLHIQGKVQKHYALNNQMEYFAELSESYFGTNDFFPFVRPELKKHDPTGFEVIERAWGVQQAAK